MTSYPAGGYSASAWSFIAAPPNAYPASIAESANYDSGIMVVQGYNAISASAELTEGGVLTLQRYLDAAGTIPIGAAVTQALTANTVGTASVNDGMAFSSLEITITNSSSSSAATLSNAQILLSQTGYV